MWDIVPACFRRHKKKLLFLSGVVGGVVFFHTYLKRKMNEWEMQRTAEICDQLKRSSHFETTMQNCDNVFVKFSSKIRSVITKAVDVNMVVKQVSANPPNKVELWEELKILVFVQALGEMYAQCLLCILIRIQMSILSGYVFANRFTNSCATEKQAQYLSCIESFLLNGVHKLLGKVRTVVEAQLRSVPLHTQLKLVDVELWLREIQSSMLLDNSTFFLDVSHYVMPAGSSSAYNDEFLDSIFVETRDVIECDDFLSVLQACTECGISSLLDRISECYAILSDGEEKFTNPNDFTAPLAKLIPIMHNVFCQHLPTEQSSLAFVLIQLAPLNKFAANIYEAFSHKI